MSDRGLQFPLQFLKENPPIPPFQKKNRWEDVCPSRERPIFIHFPGPVLQFNANLIQLLQVSPWDPQVKTVLKWHGPMVTWFALLDFKDGLLQATNDGND